jgi:hypothetical protein
MGIKWGSYHCALQAYVTPRSTVLETLTVTQLVQKLSSFTEADVSSPCSQQPPQDPDGTSPLRK